MKHKEEGSEHVATDKETCIGNERNKGMERQRIRLQGAYMKKASNLWTSGPPAMTKKKSGVDWVLRMEQPRVSRNRLERKVNP